MSWLYFQKTWNADLGVLGRMLYTMQCLELEWKAIVNAVQSAVATKQLARTSLIESRLYCLHDETVFPIS